MSITAPPPGSYSVVDTRGFFPWCIRRLTRSKYSHAYVNLGGGLILEAEPAGSQIVSVTKYDGLPVLTSEPAPGYRQAADIEASQKQWLDIPYGFLDIVWLGLAYGTGWRPRWLMNEVRDDNDEICSQLVAAWGAAHGANWSCGQQHDQEVTPGMLAKRIGP